MNDSDDICGVWCRAIAEHMLEKIPIRVKLSEPLPPKLFGRTITAVSTSGKRGRPVYEFCPGCCKSKNSGNAPVVLTGRERKVNAASTQYEMHCERCGIEWWSTRTGA